MTPNDYKLPGGWQRSDAAVAQSLEAELQRELPQGHLLFGVPVEAFGHSLGSDDVLFRHRDKLDRFTIVHLTWVGHTEINALHPTVEFDGTFTEFLACYEEFLAFLRGVSQKPRP